MILASWLHTTRLSVANTMLKKQYSQQWSHQLWSTGVRRLVDYVFDDTCSKQSLSDACAGDELAASSDHRAVMATFRYGKPKKPRGRKPKQELINLVSDPAIKEKFHTRLDACLLWMPTILQLQLSKQPTQTHIAVNHRGLFKSPSMARSYEI